MAVPSIETCIRDALKARLATLPMLADYPLHWADDLPAYEPQPSQPYLRASWHPNATRRLFLNGADPHQRPGILQVDVFGKIKAGVGVATEVAGQVALHFAADTRMNFNGITTRVTKAPSLAGPFIDTHIQVPVTVEIETYA